MSRAKGTQVIMVWVLAVTMGPEYGRTMASRIVRRIWRLTGLLAVIMALVSQLAQASLVIPDEPGQNALAALEAASVLCQAGQVPGGERPLPHRSADVAICPLSVALALPAIILSPEPSLPTPRDVPVTRQYARPPVRAPPSYSVVAAYPRGPPTLV